MPSSKTILARTVIGKGQKTSRQKNTVKSQHKADGVLGCWIMNHKYKAERKDGDTEVSGNYEVHVWYSFEEGKQTAVVSQSVSYGEQVKVKIFNELERRADGEVMVQIVNEPVCIDVDILTEENQIEVEVEISFLVKELAELYLTIETFSEELANFEEELEEALSDIDHIIPEIFDEE